MSEQSAFTKPAVISELVRSPHGNLADYVSDAAVGPRAAASDPEFFAHLVAWNAEHGEIRDARVALPVVALAHAPDVELADNAVAHVASLDPRLFVQATDFMRSVRPSAHVAHRSHFVRRLVTRYVREKEAHGPEWERCAVQHRRSMQTLYRRYHVRPGSAYVNDGLLRGHPESGRLAAVRALSTAEPEQVEVLVRENRLPFLVARGAVAARAREPKVLAALIRAASPTELVTNAKGLQALIEAQADDIMKGQLRDVLAAALGRSAGKRMRGAALKAATAAAAVAPEGSALREQLTQVQEAQVQHLGKVEGRWLVLGDRSGSMSETIDMAREVAGLLAAVCGDAVHLVFFDDSPTYFDATGKSYAEIRELTKRVAAGGSTSIGCGLQLLVERNLEVDGVAIITDAGENAGPYFSLAYANYEKKFGTQPSVYMFLTRGGGVANHFVEWCRQHATTFDLRGNPDSYSIPALVPTMRVGRYGLLDDIMATPLKTLDGVLARTAGQDVLGWR